ncbi:MULTISPECIES: ABC transporter substrate-binding protein [unclassified Sinorhizobium]|uniref:ABC transporter substrate-binding protein n=1 Tax=unclassified Sinorhizobium TaxID=2613772 RepID=UPI0024C3339D|nr:MULTISPECIES: ABC transporter substrate-binding protein [unclassified Sinorhizobium]MDK1378148.1 ABC transporter substrate-binding protein [Sinorhizobium sp. 6-70]MDK1479803.1 ABC transporter substrate-binding protein [Sinorhizobium sp. 6-117]
MISDLNRRDFLRGTAAIAAGALAAPALAQSAPIALRIITSTPKELYDGLCADFAQKRPDIRVTVDTPSPDYDDLTLRVRRASVIGDVPDVAFQGFNRINLLAQPGPAIPLDPFVNAEGNQASLGYQPSLLDMAKVNGKTFGLPFAISSPTLFFNLDLVEKAGGNPDKLPADWPDIIELGRRIRGLENGVMGLHYAYIGHSGAWTWMALVMSQGGRIMTPDQKDVGFDSPEGLWSLEMFKQFGQAGQIEMSLNQSRQAFSSGTMGILGTASSYLRSAEKAAMGEFQIRTANLPLKPNGKLPVGGNAAMIVTKDPIRQKAAWDFIKYMTGPEAQTKLVNTTGYIPANDIAVRTPEFLGRFYADNPNAMVGVQQLPILTAWPGFPGQNAIKITDLIRDHIQSVVTLRREPKAVLHDMVRDVRALLPPT